MMLWMELAGWKRSNQGTGARSNPCLHLPGALMGVVLLFPAASWAQVSYVARFALERQTFLLGEPIFCTFTIQNTGSQIFAFSYRTPSRILNPELAGEPRFSVRDENGHPVPDPAPQPCGGAKGSAVYGSVTLPPGQVHTERWLVNQWARFARPGSYRLRAERRLPLVGMNATTQEFSGQPVAYALAVNELSFEVTPATESQLQAVFRPYESVLEKPEASNLAETVLAITTLPQPFLLPKLVALANAPTAERRWDRQQALEGLARLGSRTAWEEIVKVARGGERTGTSAGCGRASADDPLRAYAVLLLGEKGDPAFLPPLLALLSPAPETLRGDIIRALGFFNDPRANQALFERLRSRVTNDRVNAVLGLRNLESRDSVPALIAMLSDMDSQVRQVAHFALQSLTGEEIILSSGASAAECRRVAEQWHAWWRQHGASFVPARAAPCQDW